MTATVVPLERPCIACATHRHGSCWAYHAAIGLIDHEPCNCRCRDFIQSAKLKAWAIEDMEKHGTLAEYVKAEQAVRHGSLTNHATRGKRLPHN